MTRGDVRPHAVTRAPFAVAAGARTLVGGGAPPRRAASEVRPGLGWGVGVKWPTLAHTAHFGRRGRGEVAR